MEIYPSTYAQELKASSHSVLEYVFESSRYPYLEQQSLNTNPLHTTLTGSLLWLYNPSIDTGSLDEACRGINLLLEVDHKTAYAPSFPAQALIERCGKNPGDYLRQLIRQVEKLIERRLGVAIEDTSTTHPDYSCRLV
jgi:hypothetical protein